MGIVTRSAMRSYLECDGDYCEIGEGFTEFTENKNPREYSRQYINEASERTDLVGFAPSVTYAFDVYEDDPVQEKLLSLSRGEAVGAVFFSIAFDASRACCSKSSCFIA